MRPFSFTNSQSIEFSVIFKDNTIFIEQDNTLFMKLKPNNSASSLNLSLEGMNCVAMIQRTEAYDEDIKRLDKIDVAVDNSCSICLDNAVRPYELPCEHTFCRDCITGWLKKQN